MGKVNIKIRRKPITADSLEKYRNYPALLKKYKRDKQFKRALKIFLYSLALTAFILLLVFVSIWKVFEDKRQENSNTYKYVNTTSEKSDTLVLNVIYQNTKSSITTLVIRYNFNVENIIDTLEFPLKKSLNNQTDEKLIAEKSILIQNKEFKVSKYKSYHSGHNVSATYYYEPNIGIIIIAYSSSSHFAYNQYEENLVEKSNLKIENFLPDLIKAIKSDTSFYSNSFP